MGGCIGGRRGMVLGIWMGLMMVLIGSGPAAAADAPKTAAITPGTVTIQGFISNINDIGGYIVSGSYIQLYPCDITGKLRVDVDKQGKPVQPIVPPSQKYYIDGMGRLVPPSGLPRTIFPDFGSFSFDKIQGLTPGGCYKICVKMLDRPYPGFVPLVGPDGKTREIIIPEIKASGSPQDIVIDLSKEPLIIPDPSNLPQDPVKEVNKPVGKNSGADFWK